MPNNVLAPASAADISAMAKYAVDEGKYYPGMLNQINSKAIAPIIDPAITSVTTGLKILNRSLFDENVLARSGPYRAICVSEPWIVDDKNCPPEFWVGNFKAQLLQGRKFEAVRARVPELDSMLPDPMAKEINMLGGAMSISEDENRKKALTMIHKTFLSQNAFAGDTGKYGTMVPGDIVLVDFADRVNGEQGILLDFVMKAPIPFDVSFKKPSATSKFQQGDQNKSSVAETSNKTSVMTTSEEYDLLKESLLAFPVDINSFGSSKAAANAYYAKGNQDKVREWANKYLVEIPQFYGEKIKTRESGRDRIHRVMLPYYKRAMENLLKECDGKVDEVNRIFESVDSGWSFTGDSGGRNQDKFSDHFVGMAVDINLATAGRTKPIPVAANTLKKTNDGITVAANGIAYACKEIAPENSVLNGCIHPKIKKAFLDAGFQAGDDFNNDHDPMHFVYRIPSIPSSWKSDTSLDKDLRARVSYYTNIKALKKIEAQKKQEAPKEPPA